MKNGILYFLKLDRISWAARIVLVAIVLSIPKLPPQGSALPTAITVGAVAAFFSLFHVRSNKHVRMLIKNAETEFIRDFRHHFELSESCELYVTRSYAADERLYLSHRLDGMLIYPNLIFLTYYKLMNRTVLQVRVKSLLRESAHEDFFYEIPNGSSIDIKTERIDAKIEQVSVKMPPVNGREIPEFPMKSDFHLRELLAAAGCPNTETH